MVGDLCDPAMAMALIRNPISKLPQSPRKIEAGLKLYRRNPLIAPASASVSIRTTSLWPTIATTQLTRVDSNAEPAASPSSPSIRLNALVIQRTQRIVSGSPTSHPRGGCPARIVNREIPIPFQYSKTAASACTEDLV